MRQRKVKNAEEKLMAFSKYVLNETEAYKGRWSEVFGNENKIHVEIGTGRGKFITTLAEQNPEINFIGIEARESVLLRAAEKADEKELDNLKLLWKFADDIEAVFSEDEIGRIYINFCDPWPKERHAKRRLIHKRFLDSYKKILNRDGKIEFKTDNDDLFEFAVEEFADCGFRIENLTRDLKKESWDGNVTTEYEERYMELRIKINRCEAYNPK